jgi:cyclic pyranopterin phosphate synthase
MDTLEAIRSGTTRKGDVIAVARIAGIMAAKRTAELIPLCHPIPLTDVDLTIEFDDELPGVRVTSSAKTAAQTGVEMEAIVAASVTLLTILTWEGRRDLKPTIVTVGERAPLGLPSHPGHPPEHHHRVPGIQVRAVD